MGYDVHITRTEEWADSERTPITAAEWLEYVSGDAELTLAGDNGPYFAVWSGKSQYSDPWFDWACGRVSTKNPDPPLVAKAIQIAERLRARAQGDDGEVYLPDGKVQRDGVIDTSVGMDWRTW